ncbi:MAG: xanthan lyase [Bacteroidales bacterium]
MMKPITFFLVCASLLFTANSLNAQKIDNSRFTPIADSIQKTLKTSAFVTGKIRIDSVIAGKNLLKLFFNQAFSEYPFREDNIKLVYQIAKSLITKEYEEVELQLFSNGSLIEEFVPPLYKSSEEKIRPGKIKKAIKKQSKEEVLIVNESKPYTITNGLQKRHIALWQSHGYYYEQKLLRWEWQRARIFQTVEDLYTQSYVVPFLVPMLENAGANLFLPRERDFQINEVIVDNDIHLSGYIESSGDVTWITSATPGFSNCKDFYLTGENPFTMGTFRYSETTRKGTPSVAKWVPQIPESGEYAVYVAYHSFPNSTEKARYIVKHSGGETIFNINQKMGGGTWIYLGTFSFSKGEKEDQGVILSNFSTEKGAVITADAVKFGGGMGNIARKPSESGVESNRKSSSNEPITKTIIDLKVEPEISNYPRFTEGARYWLQWAGFNDTIYSPNRDANDYNDDYMSRGRWVNVLCGGSAVNPEENGLKIPLDLAFAFHTDAGTTLNDSIIGTLGIYTRLSNGNDKFPDGTPRFTSRFLTDIIQTQIVDDIKYLYEPIWQRRGIWDKSYAESRAPKVPSMLLELLSHQNFADMRYGLDPNFRFNVSRSIYKGMLKYLSSKSGIPYIVQPLPVKNIYTTLQNDSIKISWDGVTDPLEPTATPKRYIVYKRENGGGFDNGTVVNDPIYTSVIEKGKIYSYKITALNDGGESFPSEIVSLYSSPKERGKVLIINGFDKVSAPYSFASEDKSTGGFYDLKDRGVPYKYDISYIGSQYEYRRSIPWMDDDSPGFGASYADFEAKATAGNSFDYPFIHGKYFAEKGYSFISISRDALINNSPDLTEYSIVDLILGKQMRYKPGRGVKDQMFEAYPLHLRQFLTKYSQSGGNILVSGAHIATDIWDSGDTTSVCKDFAMNTLKYQWRTANASKTGEVKSVNSPFGFSGSYSFYTEPNNIVYPVESPDGIEPVGNDAWTIFRYSDNNISAGVAFKGGYRCVALGFPIETLKSEEQIGLLISSVIKFFEK